MAWISAHRFTNLLLESYNSRNLGKYKTSSKYLIINKQALDLQLKNTNNRFEWVRKSPGVNIAGVLPKEPSGLVNSTGDFRWLWGLEKDDFRNFTYPSCLPL